MENCLPSALWAVTSCQDWVGRGLQPPLHLLAVLAVCCCAIAIQREFLVYVVYRIVRSSPRAGILSTAPKLVTLLLSSQFYNILYKNFITKLCKTYFSSLLNESDVTLLI